MANTEWDNASTDKKLEMLRNDIGRIFEYLNRIIADLLLKEVATAVEAIEKQMPKAAKKK